MPKKYEFYDKIAKKYGLYDVPHRNILKEYFMGNPEEVFKNLVLDYSGKNKTAIDIGCGDGKFTLSLANHFKKIFAIDLSKGLLNIAIKLRQKKYKEINNVFFNLQDAKNTLYSNNSFDLAYSRRGPIPYNEIGRLLKPNGIFVGIEITGLDCKKLKKVFGRGQNYGQWDIKKIKRNIQKFKKIGFKILFAKDYFFNEYYSTYEELDSFLKRVPIFEDFDSQKDKQKLSHYAKNNNTLKGIKLLRHKAVIIVQKKYENQ